jgi:hypothetical protein
MKHGKKIKAAHEEDGENRITCKRMISVGSTKVIMIMMMTMIMMMMI